MKKFLVLFVIFMMLATLVIGCANDEDSGAGETKDPDEVSETENGATEEPAAEAIAGEKYETDNFSIVVPDGWEVMDVEGGVQLYKMSGEVFEVHFRGSGQSEGHVEQQTEFTAENYEGTTPEEVDLLGKRFWTTSYTAAGVPQVSYITIENGVMISVKYGGPDYQDNPDFEGILNSIVFK